MTFKQLIKDWTLPISMMLGAFGYLLFSRVEALHGMKVALVEFVPFLLPALIFVMLFFTYCKIDPKELRPRRWHHLYLCVRRTSVFCAILCRQADWFTL